MGLHVFTFSAMSCRNEIHVHADSEEEARAASALASAEVLRIEQLWSRYRPDSIVSRINTAAGGAPVAVDAETAALIDYAATAWRQSDGAFDITSGVLRHAWNFAANTLPDPAEVAALLPLIGWHQVAWRDRRIALPRAGMEIDFGGLGKEYAADRAAALLAERGYAALVNLGGDMVATAPCPDGQAWQIGIRDPNSDTEQLAAHLPLFSGAIATSGSAERHIDANGRRYGHILDPRTGWPPPDAPASVSVLAPSCLVAGTLATIAMLKGIAAEDWLRETEAAHFVVRAV